MRVGQTILVPRTAGSITTHRRSRIALAMLGVALAASIVPGVASASHGRPHPETYLDDLQQHFAIEYPADHRVAADLEHDPGWAPATTGDRVSSGRRIAGVPEHAPRRAPAAARDRVSRGETSGADRRRTTGHQDDEAATRLACSAREGASPERCLQVRGDPRDHTADRCAASGTWLGCELRHATIGGGRPPAPDPAPARGPARVHRGGSIAAAAYELGISETTARQHLSGLYRRTGYLNAAQAAYLSARPTLDSAWPPTHQPTRVPLHRVLLRCSGTTEC